MKNIKSFHPGLYLKESLQAMEMTAKEFSFRTGISERILSAIINEKCDITFDVAFKLAKYFDCSINFWTNLQNQYNLYKKEKEEELDLQIDWNLIKNIKPYLVANKYINEDDNNQIIVEKIRKIIGVNKLSFLENKDMFVSFKEKDSKKENDIFLQNFWIALALNEARKIKCNKYSKIKLNNSIKEIKNLTMTNQKYFYQKLKDIFLECGISFVILPYLSNSNIYGVTKWLNKNNVMVAISNKSERADIFWFTLFHEISHVLMEHHREFLINVDGFEDDKADKMANELLINSNKWNEFILNNDFSVNSINNFALSVGILPSIVTGRLYKENYISYENYNKRSNVKYKF